MNFFLNSRIVLCLWVVESIDNKVAFYRVGLAQCWLIKTHRAGALRMAPRSGAPSAKSREPLASFMMQIFVFCCMSRIVLIRVHCQFSSFRSVHSSEIIISIDINLDLFIYNNHLQVCTNLIVSHKNVEKCASIFSMISAGCERLCL